MNSYAASLSLDPRPLNDNDGSTVVETLYVSWLVTGRVVIDAGCRFVGR